MGHVKTVSVFLAVLFLSFEAAAHPGHGVMDTRTWVHHFLVDHLGVFLVVMGALAPFFFRSARKKKGG